jgi:hypothetical protein
MTSHTLSEQLLPELVQLIAMIDSTAWSKLCLVDRVFNNYAHTDQGISHFAELFTVVVNTEKYTRYELRGKIHRDGDLPAMICEDGTQVWYRDGNRHRDGNLPAVVSKGGYQGWYQNGKLHRDGDLPAVIHADGTQYWYQNGKLHRDGAPAAITRGRWSFWYQNGVRTKTVLNV